MCLVLFKVPRPSTKSKLEANSPTKQNKTTDGRGKYSRHPHGEAADDTFVIERLEDVPTDRRVVDTCVFVVAEVWEVLLPDVHHSPVMRVLATRCLLGVGLRCSRHILGRLARLDRVRAVVAGCGLRL
jgi:hypothetical protein